MTYDMSFTPIDPTQWSRSEHFFHFMSVGATIELTVKADVTRRVGRCRETGESFQARMLFLLTEVVNGIENLRLDAMAGQPILWDRVVPTFTAINPETMLFHVLHAPIGGDFASFEAGYRRCVARHEAATSIVPQGMLPKNAFNVSMIPWLHFEHFSSKSRAQENAVVKMITMGRFEERDGRMRMPVTLQVSHAVADGYHAALFFESLQSRLDE